MTDPLHKHKDDTSILEARACDTFRTGEQTVPHRCAADVHCEWVSFPHIPRPKSLHGWVMKNDPEFSPRSLQGADDGKMQETDAEHVFGDASTGWPDGPHLSGVVHGINLIPISGAGVDGMNRWRSRISGKIQNRHDQIWDDFVNTENHPSFKSNVCSHVRCGKRKSARVCVRWGVVCTIPVTFMAVVSLNEKSIRKKRTDVQDNKRNQNSGRRWQHSKQYPVAISFVTQVWTWIFRCHSYLLSHHFLSSHSWQNHSSHWWSQDELHHVELCEDGDDNKFVFQLTLDHSMCCWTPRSSVLCCLVPSVTEWTHW